MPVAGAIHINVRIFATRVAAGPQCVLSWIADDETCAVDISIDGDGLVQLELTEDYGQKLLITTTRPIAADRWNADAFYDPRPG